MTHELLEDLRTLRSKFPDPTSWTKGYWALNKCGGMVASADKLAVCFCLDGAIINTSPGDTGLAPLRRYQMRQVLGEVIGLRHSEDIIDWNDSPGRKFEDVTNALDSAIYRVEHELGLIPA